MKSKNKMRYKYQYEFPASGYKDGKRIFADKKRAENYVKKQKEIYPHLRHYLIEIKVEEV